MDGNNGNAAVTAGCIAFAILLLTLFPMGLTLFAPDTYNGSDPDEVLEGYERFTGQKADTKVSVWPLTGIYTPFTGSFYDIESGQTVTYGFSSDNWLYGTEVKSYSPSQYLNTSQQYTVYKADDGVFRYYSNSTDYNEEYGTGHKGRVTDNGSVTYAGDLYTDVNFDVLKKSDIFFVESSKQEDLQGHFKYDFTGYRMSFQPISGYKTLDQDGNVVPIVATTTSLSLIWYQTAGQSGISGNLVLSGNSSGVAYINSQRVLSAFDANTSTAAFDLVFNGVKMTVYIKIDPVYTNQGWTVQQCYDGGYWSIMVTSLSVDSSAYTGTDNSNNPMQILETLWDLFTFNLGDYDLSPMMENLCYLCFAIPLYIDLLVLCLSYQYLWILVGLLAAFQALGSWWPF